MNDPKCLKCGGTNLKPGSIWSWGAFFRTVCCFRPEGLSSKKPYLLLTATMCVDCGFVEISGDPEAAKAVIRKIETGG